MARNDWTEDRFSRRHRVASDSAAMRRTSALIFSVALVLCRIPVSAQQHGPHTMEDVHRLHQDPKAYIAMLEDPQRDAYQKPHEVLTALNLKRGDVVADIGAGSGYFSFRLVHHVGEEGRVYAVDISPDMILHINRRARDLGVKNLSTVLSDADDPLLPKASVDVVFICEVWHHIENQAAYLDKIHQVLKPGGRVVMIDFHKRELPVGPPVEMKIAREDLLTQMQSKGFRLIREHSFLPYQYFLIFSVK